MAASAAFQIFMRKVGDVTFSNPSGQPAQLLLICAPFPNINNVVASLKPWVIE